jgi:hypothetical protein
MDATATEQRTRLSRRTDEPDGRAKPEQTMNKFRAACAALRSEQAADRLLRQFERVPDGEDCAPLLSEAFDLLTESAALWRQADRIERAEHVESVAATLGVVR